MAKNLNKIKIFPKLRKALIQKSLVSFILKRFTAQETAYLKGSLGNFTFGNNGVKLLYSTNLKAISSIY
jgi:hypothetical protein